MYVGKMWNDKTELIFEARKVTKNSKRPQIDQNIIDHFLVWFSKRSEEKACKAFDGIEFFAVAELGNIEFIDWKSFFNKIKKFSFFLGPCFDTLYLYTIYVMVPREDRTWMSLAQIRF